MHWISKYFTVDFIIYRAFKKNTQDKEMEKLQAILFYYIKFTWWFSVAKTASLLYRPALGAPIFKIPALLGPQHLLLLPDSANLEKVQVKKNNLDKTTHSTSRLLTVKQRKLAGVS